MPHTRTHKCFKLSGFQTFILISSSSSFKGGNQKQRSCTGLTELKDKHTEQLFHMISGLIWKNWMFSKIQWSNQLTWCFTPSQPLWLHQGDKHNGRVLPLCAQQSSCRRHYDQDRKCGKSTNTSWAKPFLLFIGKSKRTNWLYPGESDTRVSLKMCN